MIRAVAIDDEPLALEVIKKYVERVPFLFLEACFVNAFDALEYIEDNEIDLLFLDVKMPDISGISFYHKLSRKPLLIFTTAYSEHAVTGFELEAMDYLLKPFLFERFLKACQKAKEALNKLAATDYIFIKDGYELKKVCYDSIFYIETAGNYMRYVLDEKEVLTRATIKETLGLLPKERFVQTHRSFIVNVHKIIKIDRYQIVVGPNRIPVSTTYGKDLKKRKIY